MNLTPFEAGKVLAKAAHRLGTEEIPNEYLREGHLSEILTPDDYQPIQNVSNSFTLLMVLGCLLE